MGILQFIDVQTGPTEVLDLTGITLDEFQPLVPPLRPCSTCRWPTGVSVGSRASSVGTPLTRTVHRRHAEDRLLFSPAYLKTYPFQAVQERLFGMGQNTAHQTHVSPASQATRRTLRDAPGHRRN